MEPICYRMVNIHGKRHKDMATQAFTILTPCNYESQIRTYHDDSQDPTFIINLGDDTINLFAE